MKRQQFYYHYLLLFFREFKAYSDEDLWQVISEQAWVDSKLALTISLGEVVQEWLTGRLPLVTVATDYLTNTTTFTQVFLFFIQNIYNNTIYTYKSKRIDNLKKKIYIY